MRVVLLTLAGSLILLILDEKLSTGPLGANTIAYGVRFVMTILLVCGLITAMHLK
jgi:hypothetical protein